MLQQILKDMYIDPELLAELSEEQKQVLFIKMREEQIRRWKEHEDELEKTENVINLTKKKSGNKKGSNVQYLLGADGNPWIWVLGESDEDASEDEKLKSLRALEDNQVKRKAKELAEKEAAELRKKELAAIELRTRQRKNEEEKLAKDRAEKEKLVKANKQLVDDSNEKAKNKLVIKLDDNEQRELKSNKNTKEKEQTDRRRLEELRERKRKEEERLEAEKKENEKKKKEAADKRKQDELRKQREREEEERQKKELARKEAEEKRIQELEKQKKEEEKRLEEIKRLEEQQEEIKRIKELKEKQDQRAEEIYEKIKKQNEEERKRDEETRKNDYEAWIEREKKAKEAEFERRSSVSMARREVKRREEEVRELQTQGFIEVASGLYRRFSQSKSKVHRVDIKQTESMKRERPTISSPELISATGATIPVRSIKPPKPERSPPSIPRRNTRLGPAPPPPVNNGPRQKRAVRPNNRQQIIEWWQEVELPKGSGFENDVALPWFHGIISRQEAETLLEEKPVGSFLVRVSERVWGYTISYRAVDRCKHFLIDTSDNSYQFFGHNQIAHASLNDLVQFHRSKPVSGIGRELLLKPCGQKELDEPDYKELVSQTTTI